MAVTRVFIPTSNLFRPKKILFTISKKMSSSDNEVIFESKNNAGVITLNRPKALNSLNLSMVNKIYPVLKKWENEKSLVLIKGAGDKAFCAGGDVKAVVEAGLRGDRLGHEFFKQEYRLNGLIGKYKIPYIAIIDGITMGGGVGLSVHGRYRVATERTLFAMPETAIGLFPDVGGSYFLPRLKNQLGLYLALTGHRLKGQDVTKASIATHFCQSSHLNELENNLLSCNNDEEIKDVLLKYQPRDSHSFSLEPFLEKIKFCFFASDVEDIFDRLEKDNSKWAIDTLKVLKKMSPTSLKITVEELKYGIDLTLDQCLEMEYKMAVAVLEGNEFFEGVRALLIDKDQQPKWNPASISAVTSDIVQRHFPKDSQNILNKL